MKMKCALCDGKLVSKKVPYVVYGIKLGDFPAEVCSNSQCSEVWLDEKTAKKIEEVEKKSGIFGLSKESKVSYSGSSLIVRIPKRIADFLGIKKEAPVIIHPSGKNKIEIELK